ncbi:MAG: surface lipoprotein assembly modifier [Castellaniella sp.]|uniref:surface lipoprotein assembly modifier n=1 Tax=Castellaniella sp. TaxID=1955812 RepID=UPI003C72A2EB
MQSRVDARSWIRGVQAVLTRSALACLSLLASASISQASGAPDAARIIAQGAAQVQAGRGAQAYRALSPHVSWLAGNPGFDRVFGQAALAADQPSQAAFAFERCLAVSPRDGLCRLGMLRAHVMLTEVQAARNEIEIISHSAPPPEVQAILDEYMRVLTGKESAGQDTRLNAYIQAGVGYDSNPNTAMSQGSLALPALGNLVFRMSSDGRPQETGFNLTQFNIRYSTPLNAHWRLLAEGTATGNQYWSAHSYDAAIVDGALGLMRTEGPHRLTVKAQGQHYNLGGHGYRDMASLLGQYAYAVTDRAEVNGFAHVTQMRYPGRSLNDATRYAGGVSWSQALANGRAIYYASAYGGREVGAHSNAPATVDYDFSGLRVGGMMLLSPRTQAEAGVGVEWRNYGGKEVLFGKARSDTQYDAYVNLSHALNRKLSIRPEYRYINSQSNIELRDYQRHIFSVSLRYELF